MSKLVVRGFASLSALVLAATPLAAAQPVVPKAESASEGVPIVFGQSYTIKSRVLGDDRIVNVRLPDSYGEGGKSYPILVVLDGGTAEDFFHIASLAQIVSAYGRGTEMIVVGVQGVDRRHDLSPPTDDPADLKFTKKPGGAGAYRRFLSEELKPWIAARFRTDGRSALIGESMAGLFVLDTIAESPSAFSDYIAVSPILWWNGQALSRKLASAPPATGPERRLFVAFEGSMAAGPAGPTPAQQAEARVEQALQGRPNVSLVRFADERHDTIYHPAALAALRRLYAK